MARFLTHFEYLVHTFYRQAQLNLLTSMHNLKRSLKTQYLLVYVSKNWVEIVGSDKGDI